MPTEYPMVLEKKSIKRYNIYYILPRTGYYTTKIWDCMYKGIELDEENAELYVASITVSNWGVFTL